MTSIDKALDILMAFASNNKEAGTVELSQKLDMHPATVNRILKVLSQKSFLQQNEQTRKFSLGLSVIKLGRTVFHSLDGHSIDIVFPFINDLSEKSGETVVFDIKSEYRTVVMYIAEGGKGMIVKPQVGDSFPMHATPGGKAILAFSDEKTVERYLQRNLKKITKNTITDPEILKAEFKKIKREGVAFCREEVTVGINAIAAPIFNYENKPTSAIVIMGIASSVKCELDTAVVSLLKETASTISDKFIIT